MTTRVLTQGDVQRLVDMPEAVAMAERAYGDGRVVAMAIPGDADWTSWPDEPSSCWWAAAGRSSLDGTPIAP